MNTQIDLFQNREGCIFVGSIIPRNPQEKLIWNQVYEGVIAAGSLESQAGNHAAMALEDFRKNTFQKFKKGGRGTVFDLIQYHIAQAKRSKS